MARLATLRMWYKLWNTANTTLDIYFFFSKNSHQSPRTLCRVCWNLTSVLQQLTFVLSVSFLVNTYREHLSHHTLVLLFSLWKGKCSLKVRRELFVKIIQWCWHRRIKMDPRSYGEGLLSEMKNKIPSLSSNMMLI